MLKLDDSTSRIAPLSATPIASQNPTPGGCRRPTAI